MQLTIDIKDSALDIELISKSDKDYNGYSL